LGSIDAAQAQGQLASRRGGDGGGGKDAAGRRVGASSGAEPRRLCREEDGR